MARKLTEKERIIRWNLKNMSISEEDFFDAILRIEGEIERREKRDRKEYAEYVESKMREAEGLPW